MRDMSLTDMQTENWPECHACRRLCAAVMLLTHGARLCLVSEFLCSRPLFTVWTHTLFKTCHIKLTDKGATAAV